MGSNFKGGNSLQLCYYNLENNVVQVLNISVLCQGGKKSGLKPCCLYLKKGIFSDQGSAQPRSVGLWMRKKRSGELMAIKLNFLQLRNKYTCSEVGHRELCLRIDWLRGVVISRLCMHSSFRKAFRIIHLYTSFEEFWNSLILCYRYINEWIKNIKKQTKK